MMIIWKGECMLSSRSWRRYTKGILALLFCCSMAITKVQAVDFMPVTEVKTGMTGIAKTVVNGDTISTFDVKVLGVMKDRGPSGDLILAKFSGSVIDETGGIVHGMSGSPVYMNGKLVGAVAYGWGFADGTIGMITPIEDMVKLWNIPYEKHLPNPWKDEKLIPLGNPLMAYGFDGDSLEYMKGKLPHYQYATYDTAAADGDNVAKPLVPGGAVSALLVDGDLKLGAIGTVTYVDADKVVAFGHPFLKRGSMDYFMHNAHIFTVVKSINSGFKLGSMGAEVGSVTEDRGSGIAGQKGRIVAGIPMEINLRDLDTNKTKVAQVKVIEDQEMTPALAATAVYSFLNKTIDRVGEGTSTVTFTITPNDNKIEPLVRINKFYSSGSISEKSVDEFYDMLDTLLNNSFVNYSVMNIKVDVGVTKNNQTAQIVDATATPVVVSPGDSIIIKVQLRPFRGEAETKTIVFVVPKDQPLGKATLEVRGGGVLPLPYLLEKQKYNLTDEVIDRLKTYKDFDEFYKELKQRDANHQIIVEILDDNVSVIDDEKGSKKKAKISGTEKKNMPSDIKKPKNVIDSSVLDDKKEKKDREAKLDTEYVVKGDGQFKILVVAPDKKEVELKKWQKSHRKEKDEVTEKATIKVEESSTAAKTDSSKTKK